MTVAALLVSHAGARWLPAVLSGLAAQTRPLDAIVAVDTGSKDESPELLTQALGADAVHIATRGTSFGDAVAMGLELVPDADWVWLLHDDANPAPDALAELLAAAEADPRADVLGPKLREWPSLRRLLELGITISGTGRRETGLEHGEYDQGQHDEVREVLAVNTAGMLVRRRVLLGLGGFDRNLPIFGNDLDFGWRAAWAGFRTIVVPQAVVFHAEAAHRGVRRTPLTGRHTHYQERRAALYTLLVNSRARLLPWQVLRLTFGTLLRVVGFLLVRSVGEALDELAALGSILSHPGELRAARAARAPRRAADPARVRGLLAPPWVPYRHGLDMISDLAAAATNQAQDVAERRRAARLAADPRAARHHADDEDDALEADSGWLAWFVTNPVAVLVTAFVVAVLVATRPAWGHVSGGALSPTPAAVGDWWRLYGESWHPIGTGTDLPAPAYVPVLAGLGALAGASPAAAVSLVLVLAVPLALWGAWRFLRVAGRLVNPAGISRWLIAGGAATYALVPVTSGAWGEGRLGTLVTATTLPWLAHAALGFSDPEPDRRWRAAWRSGLLLTLVTAFAPGVWLWAVALGLLLLGLGLVVAPQSVRQRSVAGPPLTALAVAPVLLVPWVWPLLASGRPLGLVMEAGRLPSAVVDATDLMLGRASDAGAPEVVGVVVLVLAVLALLPRSSRILVSLCWLAALVAAAVAAALSRVSVDVPGGSAWPGLGAFVVILQGAWLTALVLGGQEALRLVRGRASQVVHVVGAVALAILPVLGLSWFLTSGGQQLTTSPTSEVPAYMEQSALLGPAHGILLIDGTVEEGLTYTVRRGDGMTLGEDEILALTPEDEAFTDEVRTLVSRPTPAVVNGLADRGIEYVVLTAPADGRVSATLDATPGLTQASAEDRETRAWQVEKELDGQALAGPDSRWRTVLLVTQALLLLVVLVLCGPTRKAAR